MTSNLKEILDLNTHVTLLGAQEKSLKGSLTFKKIRRMVDDLLHEAVSEDKGSKKLSPKKDPEVGVTDDPDETEL